jgi:hypothetical protein
MIEQSDMVIMYFDPATKSPITLMELGFLAARRPDRVFVCCPEGFWRKGNVDIICERESIQTYDTLEKLLRATASMCNEGGGNGQKVFG